MYNNVAVWYRKTGSRLFSHRFDQSRFEVSHFYKEVFRYQATPQPGAAEPQTDCCCPTMSQLGPARKECFLVDSRFVEWSSPGVAIPSKASRRWLSAQFHASKLSFTTRHCGLSLQTAPGGLPRKALDSTSYKTTFDTTKWYKLDPEYELEGSQRKFHTVATNHIRMSSSLLIAMVVSPLPCLFPIPEVSEAPFSPLRSCQPLSYRNREAFASLASDGTLSLTRIRTSQIAHETDQTESHHPKAIPELESTESQPTRFGEIWYDCSPGKRSAGSWGLGGALGPPGAWRPGSFERYTWPSTAGGKSTSPAEIASGISASLFKTNTVNG